MDSETNVYTDIRQTIEEIAVQFRHALSVNGRARTGYYKVAIWLSASIVEALLYIFLKIKIDERPEILIGKTKKVKKLLHKLPNEILGISQDLWIASAEEQKFDLNNKITFGEMIIFCKNSNILDANLIEELNNVREKRNYLHLQGRNSRKIPFNNKFLNRVGKVILILFKKIEYSRVEKSTIK